MYSIKQLFMQEPNTVRSAVMAIIGALVITGVINLSVEALAEWGVAFELTITLFYVRPLSVSKAGLRAITNGKKGSP